MDKETLRRTVYQLYESVQSIAESNPEQFFDTGDFDRVLKAAKRHYSKNEVIQGMDTGDSESIQSVDYAQKLAILKAQIHQEYSESASRENEIRMEEAIRKRRMGFVK